MNRILTQPLHLINAIEATPQEAALYAAIGFLVVFAGIALVIAVVWLVGKILSKMGGKVTKKEEVVTPTVKKAEQSSDEIDEETLAVIMAALMSYYEQQGSRCEFIVKRIKKIQRY